MSSVQELRAQEGQAKVQTSSALEKPFLTCPHLLEDVVSQSHKVSQKLPVAVPQLS